MAFPNASAPEAQDKKSSQTPKPHQLAAEAFCRENRRIILADDMGVGKTLPSIRAAAGRTIVLCPATTKQNWRREILGERPDARVKHEVLTLPQKTRSVARITADPADLTQYQKCERRLAEEIAANPSLLRDTSFQCLAGVRHAVGLCKTKPAIARISAIFGVAGQKLVAFAHHRAVREAIAKAYPGAIVLNAETKDRDAQVGLFQSSSEHRRAEAKSQSAEGSERSDFAARLFITSPRTGGLGITLTAASAVLIVEFDFTSAVMLQAEDRVHRLGQTRHVTVEYLYANATVDGFLLALINRKQRIFDQTCDGLADPDYLLRPSKKGKTLPLTQQRSEPDGHSTRLQTENLCRRAPSPFQSRVYL